MWQFAGSGGNHSTQFFAERRVARSLQTVTGGQANGRNRRGIKVSHRAGFREQRTVQRPLLRSDDRPLLAGLRQCCHQFACRIRVIQLNRPAPHQRKLKRNPDRRVVADSVEKLGFPRCSLSPQKNDLHKPRAPNERRPHRAKPPARLACKTRFRPPESENQPRSTASLRRGRPRDLLTTGRISSE
jgi:hypothetical protein